ncbi:MAG: MMPL family transporter [Sedimentisphaerales bacterium]|jgi:predicted RND superfamily exporter protein|nr:MMPL family transporter [Sedimentisphaerales bacterium]HNY79830.1 MMPL family transporter [Sedimentisphaerales bacterium]HOC64832.1 MMPL family transporter [Sedimentisphaerales bacterium]HOH65762.1 MMPL family transporter [Sedimentisphaerales bacterium]HPY49115.1 MMPL family transporter [Sedimentisphaerales bacterium]
MKLRHTITDFSLRHYKLITVAMVVFTLGLGALIPRIRVDTDPENMLSAEEPVRVFHDRTKEEFVLSDMVVVGIVNNVHPDGVFNPESLSRIYELTEFARTLRWRSEEDPNREVGVIEVDLLAPSTVDHIGQGGPGVVTFEWLMPRPPQTDTEALAVRDKAMSNPLLKGTVVSDDGKAICLYLPLTHKDLSHRVYRALNTKITEFTGDEEYHITGLPVAEDTFGYEMFIQMAISAPLAMLVIFLLMLAFFRKLVLVISPMIVAMVAVISTMGALIGLGFPVHIMSSMIPIFLMPISVVDSVHILSEFFDRYTKEKGRRETTLEVMDTLFMPMLYTSLTSAAGFASLALTPIPPVQVFGIFVAAGIMVAWVCTVTFVPAYIMFLKDRSLENFGAAAAHEEEQTWLTRVLHSTGRLTYAAAKPILVVMMILAAIAVYGITQVNINDNPIKWFAKSHPIRQADIELNRHFSGTYMAYLVLEDAGDPNVSTEYVQALRDRLMEKAGDLTADLPAATAIVVEAEKALLAEASTGMTRLALLDKLGGYAQEKEASASQEAADVWYELIDFFDLEKERLKIFKQPEALRYIAQLEKYLEETGLVGKTNSLAGIVKKVHQELIDGKPENYTIPDSSAAVAECLIQFQSSHTPDDLWHFVTNDYDKTSLWLQLRSGDNKDMEQVVKAVDEFFAQNPSPVPVEHQWAGLTYINIVWQNKMVWGMLQSLLGSFIIVFIMMAIMFRSVLWGLVCMVPLSITIVVIYGVIGLVGKDYDMPVAVLSALTLGMAVDFAIHFLERARATYAQTGSWKHSAAEMFGEPARAISRNVLVIAIGFLPLLAAPLVPYKTVGIFLCAIMALSGVVTLLVLPAILTVAEKRLFKTAVEPQSPGCNCAFCFVVSLSSVVVVLLNVYQFGKMGFNSFMWFSIVAVPVLAVICGILSRRQACRMVQAQQQKTGPVEKE